MSDSNLVNITKIISDKRQKEEMTKLDIRASYAAIETCLTYLQMNKLKDLDKLKEEMKKSLKMLSEMSK